jgi:hypothetical protein
MCTRQRYHQRFLQQGRNKQSLHVGNRADFSAQHDWIRLIDSLKLPPRTRKMPTISRLPDARFVERKEETDRLCELLTTTPGKPIGITTAFAGSGGMGKTQLALALGQDRRLWRTLLRSRRKLKSRPWANSCSRVFTDPSLRTTS